MAESGMILGLPGMGYGGHTKAGMAEKAGEPIRGET